MRACVSIWKYVGTCVPWHISVEARGQHCRVCSLLLLYRLKDPRNQTQVINLGNKCLYLDNL